MVGTRIEPEDKSRNIGHVAVVDDNPSIHAAVREQFQQAGEPWQVTAYHNGAEALKGIATALPQVVLMAQTLPDGCGIQWAGRLKKRLPQLPVVIHTANGSPEKLFQALSAQAMGYVVSPGARAQWGTHLRKAMTGRVALCEQAERWLPQVMGGLRMGGETCDLTRREREVMVCLCRHLSDKEIGSAMGISDETVHVHLNNAFKKLGVHGRKAAARKFSQHWSGGE